MGVYGPTMKTSSSPMTSGGSSRLVSTPASHTRGKGSVPRASIQASGRAEQQQHDQRYRAGLDRDDKRVQGARRGERADDGTTGKMRRQA